MKLITAIQVAPLIQSAAQTSRLPVKDIDGRQIIQLNGEPEAQEKVKSKALTVRRTGSDRNCRLMISANRNH